GFPGKVETSLRLAPYRVERIVAQQKGGDGLGHAVAGVGQIPGLACRAIGRPREIDRARDRLRPEGNHAHRVVDPCLVGDEVVLLDEIACKPAETISLAVTVKHRAEDHPEAGKSVRGSAARTM